MPTLRQSSVATRVRDLTQRLAEDYDTIPLPEVSRVVRQAAESISSMELVNQARGGDGIQTLVARIEGVARKDLDWVRAGRLTPGSGRPAPAATHPNARHRGAA